jgi:hypothetical protein
VIRIEKFSATASENTPTTETLNNSRQPRFEYGEHLQRFKKIGTGHVNESEGSELPPSAFQFSKTAGTILSAEFLRKSRLGKAN